MRRHAWLTVSAIALFGLPGPLCALACLEAAQIPAVAAHSSEMPCHEEGGSKQPSDAEQDCDCESAAAPVLLAFDAPAQLGDVVLRIPSFRSARTAALLRFAPRTQPVPPPDILLLKSTLLL